MNHRPHAHPEAGDRIQGFGALPCVVFQRLDVRDGTPLPEIHVIVYATVRQAEAKAHWIRREGSHLRLLNNGATWASHRPQDPILEER